MTRRSGRRSASRPSIPICRISTSPSDPTLAKKTETELLMNVCRNLVVVFGIGLVANSSLGTEWTRFRGASGNGVSTESKHPAEWSEESNVAWKVKIPGRGWSQPVVTGDKVFVTTAVAENEEKPKRFDGGITPGARD